MNAFRQEECLFPWVRPWLILAVALPILCARAHAAGGPGVLPPGWKVGKVWRIAVINYRVQDLYRDGELGGGYKPDLPGFGGLENFPQPPVKEAYVLRVTLTAKKRIHGISCWVLKACAEDALGSSSSGKSPVEITYYLAESTGVRLRREVRIADPHSYVLQNVFGLCGSLSEIDFDAVDEIQGERPSSPADVLGPFPVPLPPPLSGKDLTRALRKYMEERPLKTIHLFPLRLLAVDFRILQRPATKRLLAAKLTGGLPVERVEKKTTGNFSWYYGIPWKTVTKKKGKTLKTLRDLKVWEIPIYPDMKEWRMRIPGAVILQSWRKGADWYTDAYMYQDDWFLTMEAHLLSSGWKCSQPDGER